MSSNQYRLSSSVLPLTATQIANRHAIARWLCLVLVMLFAIVMVGGATRMTGSGLSITEWKPIHGVIPPLGEAQWAEEFEKYQQIAQYTHLNQGMSLAEFKFIFWWEWVHRLLARLVGIVLVGILIVFALQKRIEKAIGWRLLAIGSLIGFQGVIGWWMVYSGLGDSDLTHVSPYRLAIHLVAASVTIIAVSATICQLLMKRGKQADLPPPPKIVNYGASALVWLILTQIYLGALVAGIHAGNAYNSWPLMDGQWIPDGLLMLQPLWLNFFENALTVQFTHRIFAYLLLIVAFFHTMTAQRLEQFPKSVTRFSDKNCGQNKELEQLGKQSETKTDLGAFHAVARRARLLLLFILAQAIFGIITLLMVVPIEWGLIHQAAALVVLCFATFHWQSTKLATM